VGASVAVGGALVGDTGLSMMAGLKEGGTEVVGTEVAGLEEEVGASAHWHLGQPSPHVYVYR